MLEVKTPREVLALIQKEFRPLGLTEEVPLAQTLGRVLAEEMGAYILTDKATFLTFAANDGVTA